MERLVMQKKLFEEYLERVCDEASQPEVVITFVWHKPVLLQKGMIASPCSGCLFPLCAVFLHLTWFWLGSLSLGPDPCSSLPTSAQTLLLGGDDGENRQVGVERKVELAALPDGSGELRQAGPLRNRHLCRDSGGVGDWVQEDW